MYLPVSSANCLYLPPSTVKQERLEIVLSLTGHVGSNPTISANKRHQLRLVPFLRLDGEDENRAAARRPQATSPAGCCLARGRISTISANKRHQLRLVPFLRLDGEDENRTAVRRPQAISPVQRRRPLPVAETGRSCWGSVLIFQSPAKGLRKNQQTQPVAVA